MLSLSPNTQIYLATEVVDMHRSFDGLNAPVMEVLAQDPLSGHLFVFSNRRAHLAGCRRKRSGLPLL